MFVKLLRSKIHRATITASDVDYVGSIAIDPHLLDEAGILPFEAVLVADVTNGARFETYVQPAEPGSGTICVNGAAAHLVNCGDLIIIFSFGYFDAEEAERHEAKMIFVDKKNRVTRTTGRGATT